MITHMGMEARETWGRVSCPAILFVRSERTRSVYPRVTAGAVLSPPSQGGFVGPNSFMPSTDVPSWRPRYGALCRATPPAAITRAAAIIVDRRDGDSIDMSAGTRERSACHGCLGFS